MIATLLKLVRDRTIAIDEQKIRAIALTYFINCLNMCKDKSFGIISSPMRAWQQLWQIG
jgi:hypothetical protein